MVVHKPDGDKFQKAFLGCNQWSCPACAKKLAWKLRKKTVNALKSHLNAIKTNGFRDKYLCKFLTLTYPGAYYRSIYSISDAEGQIKKNLNKLMTALKKVLGGFEYLWVNEGQRDGYPHLHVLLMGKAVAPKDVLWHIKDLWEKKYGMGFAFLEKVEGGPEQIAWYMSKYISKGLRAGRKYNRVYSMSRKVQKVFKLDSVPVTLVEFGRIKYLPDGSMQFQAIWQASDESIGGFPDLRGLSVGHKDQLLEFLLFEGDVFSVDPACFGE